MGWYAIRNQCHGVSTMKEDTFLVDRTFHKGTMWNGFRCSRGFPLFLVLYTIIFSSVILYIERTRWQNALESLRDINTAVSEQANLIAELQSIRTKILTELSNSKKYDKIASIAASSLSLSPSVTTIFAITPTFSRPVQKAELTRLAQTFMHVPNFHWIIVEDSQTRTNLVANLLAESNLAYTHLCTVTPSTYKLGKNDPNWKKPRGVEQRNAALRWIRDNLNDVTNGVVYFADDDNTYSIKLFGEMEKIKKVGVWPVGLVGGLMVEKPICDNSTNKVVGFNAAWKPDRTFPIDMAGFAINLNVIREKKDAWFSYEAQGGYQETELLEKLVSRDELEPLAESCTKVYVWHTRTEPPQLNAEQRLIRKGKKSNIGIEV